MIVVSGSDLDYVHQEIIDRRGRLHALLFTDKCSEATRFSPEILH